MKGISIVVSVLSIMLTSACSKNNSTGQNSGASTWTFKSHNYVADSVYRSPSVAPAIEASSTDSNYSIDPSIVVVYFVGGLPTTAGTYNVTAINYNGYPGVTTANQVGIIQYTNNNAYYSTGGNGTNQNVSVTVSQNGKVSISGSGIEMVSLNGNSRTSDSAALTLHITQDR